MERPPIINCHTHVFTGDHVPPLLAKTYVPWPFYYLIHLRPLVLFFRWWHSKKGPARSSHLPPYKRWIRWRTRFLALLDRAHPLPIAIGYYLFAWALLILVEWATPFLPTEPAGLWKALLLTTDWLDRAFPDTNLLGKLLVLGSILLFFPAVRNALMVVVRLALKLLGKLPGPQTKELLRRYLQIGRYAFYKSQDKVFFKLRDQYPSGTGFIVLPMDMEFMHAGRCVKRYRDQMKELADLKLRYPKQFFPFVFADPRRFVPLPLEKRTKAEDKPYFTWTCKDARVVPGDCFVRDYLEEKNFSGIKLYPALGYYPFDVRLLGLWKYCADNGIPVLSHCIRGTIFYRGVKKQAWNTHPVFRQAMGRGPVQPDGKRASIYEPLVLPEWRADAVSYNFTHPLNYLCLLDETLLHQVIGYYDQQSGQLESHDREELQRVKELFGYQKDRPLAQNLRKLKICLAHFGGDDEWLRFQEQDRYPLSNQLAKYPGTGIRFRVSTADKPSGQAELLWKFTDWYSIICSLMLQYEHVYADISYILHSDRAIVPLLKQTLSNPGLRSKVLYGTDFFVVRNHKSDKNMLTDFHGGLSPEDFDQIARSNPARFLKNMLPLANPVPPFFSSTTENITT